MTATTSSPSITERLYAPDGIVRTADLQAAGMSSWALSQRCRPGGAWQRPLPGVVLLSAAPPTARQRLRAALTYAGEDAVATGLAALHEHGLPLPSENAEVHILIPAHRRVSSAEYVVVERTGRLPVPDHTGGVAVAPVARAVIDAARRACGDEQLRALLMAPLKAGRCGVGQLRAELDAGNQRGTAAPRAVLATLADELSSLTKARARRALRGTPLPPPTWAARLRLAGEQVTVDAWWPDARLAWIILDEAASVEPDRPHRLAWTEATVVRTPLARLRDEPDVVGRQLMTAYVHGAIATGRTECATAVLPADPQPPTEFGCFDAARRGTLGEVTTVIRAATEADASGIARVHVETWQAAYAGQLPDEFLASLSVDSRRDMWARGLREPALKAATFVAVQPDGEITGFVHIGPNRDEDATVERGELYAIYVSPRSWSTGLGSILHAEAVRALREAGFQGATLWVLRSNSRARAFYERVGWTLDGTSRVDHIGNLPLEEVRYAHPLG